MPMAVLSVNLWVALFQKRDPKGLLKRQTLFPDIYSDAERDGGIETVKRKGHWAYALECVHKYNIDTPS